jgi:alpha-tubulin suppressor-like RCC1 family protein
MKTKRRALLIGGLALLFILVMPFALFPPRPILVGPVAPQISAGDGHAVALMADGRIYGWGRNDFGQAGFGQCVTQWLSPRIFLQRGSNWVKIATGDNHSLAIRPDGSLWSWGRNDFGQMGIGRYDTTTSDSGMPSMRPSPIRVGSDTNWVAMAAGVLYSVALKSDGSLWSWGGNWAGQLGNGTTNRLVALFSNYELASQAPKTNCPVQVGADRDWVAIAAGAEHLLALKSNGSLWGWGRNDCGQLGDGTVEYRAQPTQIGTETNWADVAAGGGFTGGHSVALKRDGSLWVWGNYRPKASPQIVMGAATATRPTRLGADNDWKQIVAGDGFTLAIKSDGSLWAVGLDCSGVLGKVNGTINTMTRIGNRNDWVAAAIEGVGYYGGRDAYCTYGLEADGTLWVWGNNLRRPMNKHVQEVQALLAKIGIKADWLNPRIPRPARFLELGRQTIPKAPPP